MIGKKIKIIVVFLALNFTMYEGKILYYDEFGKDIEICSFDNEENLTAFKNFVEVSEYYSVEFDQNVFLCYTYSVTNHYINDICKYTNSDYYAYEWKKTHKFIADWCLDKSEKMINKLLTGEAKKKAEEVLKGLDKNKIYHIEQQENLDRHKYMLEYQSRMEKMEKM